MSNVAKCGEGKPTDIEHVHLMGLESEHCLGNTCCCCAAVQDVLIQRSVRGLEQPV